MADASDLNDKLRQAGPRRVMVDNDIVETHSVNDMIAWEQHCANKAASKVGAKFSVRRMISGGPVQRRTS